MKSHKYSYILRELFCSHLSVYLHILDKFDLLIEEEQRDKSLLLTHSVGSSLFFTLVLGHFVEDWSFLFEMSFWKGQQKILWRKKKKTTTVCSCLDWFSLDILCLIINIDYTLSLSLEKHLNAEKYAGNTIFSIARRVSFTFVTEGVQGVDHELEDAVPHQWVVQRGTAAFPL